MNVSVVARILEKTCEPFNMILTVIIEFLEMPSLRVENGTLLSALRGNPVEILGATAANRKVDSVLSWFFNSDGHVTGGEDRGTNSASDGIFLGSVAEMKLDDVNSSFQESDPVAEAASENNL